MLDLTQHRKESFQIMIEHLKSIQHPIIIETGCARLENSFESNGMSTVIFDKLLQEHDGEFHSVDINPENVEFAKSHTSKSEIHLSDSVKFLYEFNKLNKKVDLLYLDSYDIDPENIHPSSFHHILELVAIMPSLKKGTMICVDDNWIGPNGPVGKGGYIDVFMQHIGKPKIYDGYQWIWIL